MSKQKLKGLIVRTPLGPVARAVVAFKDGLRFSNSEEYWEKRYKQGGTSGAGSYGRLAHLKAEILNAFVIENDVHSVIEFGCGDGNQLSLATYPAYTGVDVSEKAIELCRSRYSGDDTKSFVHLAAYDGATADLALSLDVIYHLVEDAVFENHMAAVFDAATRFVVIYASNKDEQPVEKHVRHRRFTDWVSRNRPDFRLKTQIPNRYPFDPADPDNTSFADFYIFEAKT